MSTDLYSVLMRKKEERYLAGYMMINELSDENCLCYSHVQYQFCYSR
jgi:hypothetical protein